MLLIVLKLKVEINLDSFKGMDSKIKVKRDNKGKKSWIVGQVYRVFETKLAVNSVPEQFMCKCRLPRCLQYDPKHNHSYTVASHV